MKGADTGLAAAIRTEEVEVRILGIDGRDPTALTVEVRRDKALFRECKAVTLEVYSYPSFSQIAEQTVNPSPWSATGVFKVGGYGCSVRPRLLLPRGADWIVLMAVDAERNILLGESVPIRLFDAEGVPNPAPVEPRPLDGFDALLPSVVPSVPEWMRLAATVAVVGVAAYAARPLLGIIENVTD